MTSALSQTSRTTKYLVRFCYGEPTDERPLGSNERRYTDSSVAIPGAGGMYATIGSFELSSIKNTGEIKGTEVKITLSSDSFTQYLADGTKHSPVHCFVYERHIPTSGGPTDIDLSTVFSGVVSKATASPKGKTGLIEITAMSIKGIWDIPLGLFEETHCVWPLYSGPCSAVRTNYYLALTVDSVSRNKLTVNTTPLLLAKEDNWFTKGWVEYDGIVVDVRIWRSRDPLVFHLVQDVGSYWENRVIKAYAGCDKSVSTCRARFNKESQHGGFGVAIPAYNPLYEIGGIS